MQKQKTLILIAGVAILLFASALIWKNTRVSNAEVVNYDVKSEQVKKAKKSQTVADVTINRNDEEPKDYEAIRADMEKFNKLLAFYQTPDEMYEGIMEAQEKGYDDKANDLIELLLRVDPDYELPDEIKSKK